MSAPSPVSVVTDAVSGLQGDLLTIGALGIGISAAVFALRKGWSMIFKTVK